MGAQQPGQRQGHQMKDEDTDETGNEGASHPDHSESAFSRCLKDVFRCLSAAVPAAPVVACAQRIYDDLVLFHDDIDAGGAGVRRGPEEEQRIVERSRGFEEETVSAREVQNPVKVLVRCGGGGRVRAFAGDFPVEFVKCIELGFGAMLRSHFGGRTLENDTHLVEFHDLGMAEPANGRHLCVACARRPRPLRGAEAPRAPAYVTWPAVRPHPPRGACRRGLKFPARIDASNLSYAASPVDLPVTPTPKHDTSALYPTVYNYAGSRNRHVRKVR